MITTRKIDLKNKADVKKFISFPLKLYKDVPQWVPPLWVEMKMNLNREKHPFYEHSDGDFFLAERDGEVVGRIAALINNPYNKYHNEKVCQFYYFEAINDNEVAAKLFQCVYDWAAGHGLNKIIGPKGLGAFDGYGMVEQGFEHRQMMTMMNYTFKYYLDFMKQEGFEKEVDFVSHYILLEDFKMSDRIIRIAEKALARGKYKVLTFKTKNDIKPWVNKVGRAYNDTFVDNWEYYPLSEAEIEKLGQDILDVAVPELLKIITYNDEVIGFLLAFADVSEALQKANGRLFPFGILHLLRDLKRTNWVSVNGMGIKPGYQGSGGNAILYYEMYKTITSGQFEHVDITQVAETAVQMRRDLVNLGGKPFKNHRVFSKKI